MGVVREYFVMTIGILLYTFAWIACILPAHGTGGGATGAALVLCGAIENLFNFQINIGTMAFIVNGILLRCSQVSSSVGISVSKRFSVSSCFLRR